jgi:hypothetical protein
MMTNQPLSLVAPDLGQFTRALSRQLGAASPSHLTLMNMLARAAGFQNVQHLRAAGAVAQPMAELPPDPPAVDARKVARALQQFDALGRLARWPAKRHVQTLTLWAIWAALPAGQKLSERQISALIDGEHLFGDAAILRRDMVGCGLLWRQDGGVDYLRIEQVPPPEARALIRAIAARRSARGAPSHSP